MFQEVLQTFSNGEFIIVFDKHREQEGDFFVLSEYITPEKINFLLREARGMICVACDSEILNRLGIPLMVFDNHSVHGTNFCVSVDAARNITTGVSAFDRAETIRLLADTNALRNDFVKPGHTFPLRAQSDLSKRFGHTEAAVEMSKKCGKVPVVTICEILNAKGDRANEQELEAIAEKFKIPMISLEEVHKVVI